MGLACSKSIVNEMKGDIKIKKSKRGLTVFSFKFPVIIKPLEPKIEPMTISEKLSVSELMQNNN